MSNKVRTRSAYVISTVSVTLVLFLIGVSLYFLINANKATSVIIENIKITLVLKENTTSKHRADVENILTGMGYVSKYNYISKEQALKNFGEFVGDDLIITNDSNPLPAVYEIYFVAGQNRELSTNAVKKAFEKKAYVDELMLQSEEIDNIVNNINSINIILIIVGSSLLFISMILIKNTIRANIFTKRFLIKSMLLIGATSWFIRKPFLGKAIIQGIISSLIAFGMTFAIIYFIKSTVPMVELLASLELYLFIYVVLSFLGVTLCVLMTNGAVGRYIRSANNNMHIY